MLFVIGFFPIGKMSSDEKIRKAYYDEGNLFIFVLPLKGGGGEGCICMALWAL